MNFDKWVALNNEYIVEQDKPGLIALANTGGIHVNKEAMLALPVREYEVAVRECRYHYEIKKTYLDTNFYCLLKDDYELREYRKQEAACTQSQSTSGKSAAEL